VKSDITEIIFTCDPLQPVVSVIYSRKKYYIFVVHAGRQDFHCTEVQAFVDIQVQFSPGDRIMSPPASLPIFRGGTIPG
jgi:hypothetical protein